jgi:hypothetical protein
MIDDENQIPEEGIEELKDEDIDLEASLQNLMEEAPAET